MRIVIAKQAQEKRNGTTAGVGPGEKGFNQGRKTQMKTEKRAMSDAVGGMIQCQFTGGG
jgi:hypothetical protein